MQKLPRRTFDLYRFDEHEWERMSPYMRNYHLNRRQTTWWRLACSRISNALLGHETGYRPFWFSFQNRPFGYSMIHIALPILNDINPFKKGWY
jgi:hypothetical protein